MAFLTGGDASHLIAQDVDHLRKTFEPWRDRHDSWDKMVNPSLEDNLIADRDAHRFHSDMSLNRQERSQYRTNEVRTAVDNMINRLSRANPIIEDAHTATPSLDDAEVRKGSETELFAQGVINNLNAREVDLGKGTGWLRQAYGLAAHPGKAIARVHVRRGVDGNADFRADLLDPYLCYHDYTHDLKRFVHERVVTPMEAASFLGAAGADGRTDADAGTVKDWVRISDYWLEERVDDQLVVSRAILFDGSVKWMREMPFDHLPIIVVAMNSMPRTYQRTEDNVWDGHDRVRPRDFIERHAEPFFASIEQTVRLYNTVKSLEMDGIDWVIRPPLITRPGEGESFVIEDKRLGGGVQIPLEQGQFLELLKVQNDAVVANATLVTSLEREMGRAYPPALRAEIPQASDPSGFLFNLLSDASDVATFEYALGSARLIERVLGEIYHQFKRADLSVSLSGMDFRGNDAGNYFMEDFKASQMPDSTVFRVRLAPMLPKDDLKAAQIYQLMTGPDGGLDQLTGMSQILGIRNPQAVKERRMRDAVEQSQEWLDRAKLDALNEEVRELEHEATTARSEERRNEIRMNVRVLRRQVEAFTQRLLGSGANFQQQPQPGRPAPAQQPSQERGAESRELLPRPAPSANGNGGVLR